MQRQESCWVLSFSDFFIRTYDTQDFFRAESKSYKYATVRPPFCKGISLSIDSTKKIDQNKNIQMKTTMYLKSLITKSHCFISVKAIVRENYQVLLLCALGQIVLDYLENLSGVLTKYTRKNMCVIDPLLSKYVDLQIYGFWIDMYQLYHIVFQLIVYEYTKID